MNCFPFVFPITISVRRTFSFPGLSTKSLPDTLLGTLTLHKVNKLFVNNLGTSIRSMKGSTTPVFLRNLTNPSVRSFLLLHCQIFLSLVESVRNPLTRLTNLLELLYHVPKSVQNGRLKVGRETTTGRGTSENVGCGKSSYFENRWEFVRHDSANLLKPKITVNRTFKIRKLN